MKSEFDAFLNNQTWELAPHDPTKNIVSCKRLYRLKRKADGTIDRYKARSVAKGFTQRPGIDFHSMFSSVVKPTTVRLAIYHIVDRFSIKDLGNLNFFLGVEVLRVADGITLSQSNYINEILSEDNMKDC
uniref:Uncharacterized mitochondrial protein AtMg00820-like n=1 Tax=Nicotiana tabacum TaxID=4097 RepID=A0A1S4BPI3_TOBAC